MEQILDWKSLGSLLATFVFVRTAIRDFLPPEVYHALKRLLSSLLQQPKISKIRIEEFHNSYTNELYDSVQLYLSSKCFSPAAYEVLTLSKLNNSNNLTFTMESNQKLEEMFEGFKVKWSFYSVEKSSNQGSVYSRTIRYFELSFHSRDEHKVQSSYIPNVIEVGELIRFKNRERKLYTNKPGFGSGYDDGRGLWSSVPFSHPSTFDTIAIDPVLKQEIKDDLIKFVSRRDYYNRVGRARKRGYLLYGPPGTGKTSLIAAIANFLEFDIYDLELTAITSNSQLRKLLISISSKSVIVVEDIDCSLDLSNQNKKKKKEINGEKGYENMPFGSSTVSLSGVLNFVDGLWSSCGSERLMIFATNHKEKLDQALLRPGRMDKQINLSYCEITGFKTLANNYLDINKHELKEVEQILPLVQMTPAEIAEIFMNCEDDSESGMNNFIEEIKKKKDHHHLDSGMNNVISAGPTLGNHSTLPTCNSGEPVSFGHQQKKKKKKKTKKGGMGDKCEDEISTRVDLEDKIASLSDSEDEIHSLYGAPIVSGLLRADDYDYCDGYASERYYSSPANRIGRDENVYASEGNSILRRSTRLRKPSQRTRDAG